MRHATSKLPLMLPDRIQLTPVFQAALEFETWIEQSKFSTQNKLSCFRNEIRGAYS